MHPKVSIIIPCYNSESTLSETLQSVFDQNYDDWEAILVNDGSPDNLESIALQWVEKDNRFKYFKKVNGGLGSARNFGIEKASGDYILPLDSDNKVRPEFIRKAVSIFDKQKDIGVVNGDAMYFGEKSGIWRVALYNYEKTLIKNYIDACAIFRKKLWEQVGGYDVHMPHQGNEDWEFWIALGCLNTKFYHINEVAFDYRVTNESMIHSFSKEMFAENQNYIKKKYSQEYYKYFKKNKKTIDYYNSHPLKTSLFFFKKWLKSIYEVK